MQTALIFNTETLVTIASVSGIPQSEIQKSFEETNFLGETRYAILNFVPKYNPENTEPFVNVRSDYFEESFIFVTEESPTEFREIKRI